MTSELSLDALALAAKTLGHPARLRILAMLRHNRLSVCQIASVLALPPSTVSGYLLELRRAGLVDEQRQGKWVFYRLEAPDPLDIVVRLMLCMLSGDPQIIQDDLVARTLHGTSPAKSSGELHAPAADAPESPLRRARA